MGSVIAKFKRPKTAGQLAKSINLWMEDAFGMIGNVSRDVFGGTTVVSNHRFEARVIVEDQARDDGCEWVELGEADRRHLVEWNAAGRPSLDEIAQANGIGRLTQVEAAAVRTLRAGEALEHFSFTPEEVSRMRRDIFLDILSRRVDDQFGESIDPPASPDQLAEDVRVFLLMAYKLVATGAGSVVDVVIDGRRFVGTFERKPAPRRKAVKP